MLSSLREHHFDGSKGVFILAGFGALALHVVRTVFVRLLGNPAYPKRRWFVEDLGHFGMHLKWVASREAGVWFSAEVWGGRSRTEAQDPSI